MGCKIAISTPTKIPKTSTSLPCSKPFALNSRTQVTSPQSRIPERHMNGREPIHEQPIIGKFPC